MKLTVQTTVNAPIETVWQAYNSPDDIIQWNTASEDWHTVKSNVDLREGGQFSSRMEAKDGTMGFDFAGTFTHIEEYKKIEYQFGDRHAVIDFNKNDNGIEITINFDPEDTFPIEQQQQGWQAILDNFKKYVEGN